MNWLRRVNRETSLELKVACAALLLAALAFCFAAGLAFWLEDARDIHDDQIRDLQEQIDR